MGVKELRQSEIIQSGPRYPYMANSTRLSNDDSICKSHQMRALTMTASTNCIVWMTVSSSCGLPNQNMSS